MAYDEEFRERVLEYVKGSHTLKEAHEAFHVSTTTIKAWERLRWKTESLKKLKVKRNFRKIDPEKLRTCIAENPNVSNTEIAALFQCDESAIRKALKRLEISRNKRKTMRRR